ncbi:MAG: hypothetical protein PF481_02840 [Bacteroidales bacterium]|jgi:hypothetical protein|nr:hypothetical protein [Bacteroidales bacterium]
MNKYTFSLFISLILFVPFSLFSQSMPGVWKDYFSYRHIKDIHAVEKSILAVSNLGFWMYSIESKEFRKFSKVQGLSDVSITASIYIPELQKICIGYKSGLIDIIDYPSYSIKKVSEIHSKLIYGSKSIRNFAYADSLLYVATDFGLVVYDVIKNSFITTTIIGESGNYEPVNDVAVDGDSIAIQTDGTIYTINTKSNIADISLWNSISDVTQDEQVDYSLVFFNNILYYIWQHENDNYLDSLFYIENNQLKPLSFQPGNLKSLSVHNNNLYVHSKNSITVLENDLNILHEYNFSGDTASNWYNSITVDYNNKIWYTDRNWGISLLSKTNMIYPNGLLFNVIADLHFRNNALYCVSGAAYLYHVGSFSVLVSGKWYIHYNWQAKNTLSVYALPNDEYYYGTYGCGLFFGTKSWEFDSVYSDTNTVIQAHPSNGMTYISGITSDRYNNVWIANMYSNKPLIVKTPQNKWYAYEFPNISLSDMLVREICVASNGYKWVAGVNNKLIVFYDNKTLDDTSDDDFVSIPLEDTEGKIASRSTCVVEDNSGKMWIGTTTGIAVHTYPKRVFSDKQSIARIKMEIDGEIGYLLSSEWIAEIIVDGANRKWVATQSSGVFLISADGSEQIAHYTKENSPLPSNNISAIEINRKTGEVFFGTNSGLISLMSDAKEGALDNSDMYVVPNPVRELYSGDIYIYGTTANATVKITTISGKLVYEGVANGGVATWNGRNLYGERVNTGIYLVYATNEDGSVTGITKLLVVH